MSGGSERLAYLCSDPGIPPGGSKGASVHFGRMAAALRAERADLDVFMARGPEQDGVTVVGPRAANGAARELELVASSAAMLHALEEAGPHSAVYERLSLFGLAGLAYAKTRAIPLLVEVNAPLWEEAARYRSLELRETARAIALEVMRSADDVLAVSRALADELEVCGVDPARVHVLTNGVDDALFDAARPARRPPELEGREVLAFVGSLKPWHGIGFLVETFERLRRDRPVGLWVVGDGPERGIVADAAKRWPGEVVAEGAVAHERIPGILKAADVSVAPYPPDAPDYFCPLKVVEALAAGCPLVASRSRSVVDLAGASAGHGVELFEPGDGADFARALAGVLSADARPEPDARRWSWRSRAAEVLALVASARDRREPA